MAALLNTFSSVDDSIGQNEEESRITNVLSNFTKNNTSIIFGSALIVIALSIFGISKLEVENSFINYFDKNWKQDKENLLIDKWNCINSH